MNLREVILGLLLEQPMHAYALKKVVGPRLPTSELVNDGVLYPLLNKMAQEGMIVGTTEIGRNQKVRTVYSTTVLGRELFRRWLGSEQEESDEVTYDFFLGHPFLVKVQFFKHLNGRQRAAKLQSQIDRTKVKLAQFAEILSGMHERGADEFRISLLELGVAHQRQTLKWLERQLTLTQR